MMKRFLVLSVLTLGSISAFAASIDLSGGDVITIQANQTTTVSCGGGASGGSCSDMVNGFASQVKSCADYTHSTNSCAQKYWPIFKQNAPSCVYSAEQTCVQDCTDYTHSANWCTDFCS